MGIDGERRDRRADNHERGTQEKAEENVSLYQKLRDSSTLCKALQEAVDRLEEEERRVSALRDQLIEGLLQIPKSRLMDEAVEDLLKKYEKRMAE